MSNFRSKAFNPASKRVEDAEYCDDYYGRHRYGIRFDDGCVHPEAQCGIDAAATQLDALQERVKELDGRYLGAVAARGMLRDRADEAESRATRLQQERDEAIKLIRPLALLAEDTARVSSKHGSEFAPEMSSLAARARSFVRRLAGPEKERK